MPGIDSYTKLMLHCDGADSGTTFTDDSLSPHTITNNSNLVLTKTATKKFGTASGYWGGTNTYLSSADSADWYFGTGDFTIDFWVNLSAVNINQLLMCQWIDGSNRWYIFPQDDQKLYFAFQAGGVTKASYNTTSGLGLSINTWYHIECSRNGSGALIFVNGVSQSLTEVTAFGTNDVGDLATPLMIGSYGHPTDLALTNGYLDEIRISKGICRHTSNFSPPTAPYDSSTGGVKARSFGTIIC